MNKIKVYATRMKWEDGDPDSVYVVPTITKTIPPGEEFIKVDKYLYEEMQKYKKLRGLPFPSIGYFVIDQVFDKGKLRSPTTGEMLTIKKHKIGIIEDIVEIEASL